MLEFFEIVSDTGYKKPNNNLFCFRDILTNGDIVGDVVLLNVTDAKISYFKSRVLGFSDDTSI